MVRMKAFIRLFYDPTVNNFLKENYKYVFYLFVSCSYEKACVYYISTVRNM